MGRECGACVSHTLGLGPPRANFTWQLSVPVTSTVAIQHCPLTSIHALRSLATNVRQGSVRRARGTSRSTAARMAALEQARFGANHFGRVLVRFLIEPR